MSTKLKLIRVTEQNAINKFAVKLITGKIIAIVSKNLSRSKVAYSDHIR
jgi:hypothetical protein